MTTLYKITGPNGEPIHGGSGVWPLPKVDRLGRRHRGKWWHVPKPIIACENGLHLVREDQMGKWFPSNRAFTIWEAESRGLEIVERDKIVVAEARLLRPVLEITEGVAAALKRRKQPHSTSLRELRDRIAALAPMPIAGQPIVFGVHMLEPEERECAAWPSAASWYRMHHERMIRRSRRLLGLSEALDRAVKAGVPGAVRMAMSP